jgi:hypothetical protein
MKLVVMLFTIFCFQLSWAQTFDSEIKNSKSLLKLLDLGDSIIYYQCHVEEAKQQLTTASGQTIIGKPQPYSITEKYVITKNVIVLDVKYYTSSLTIFPNKKFSGLKIREKNYWYFKLDSVYQLNITGLKVLLSLEEKGREANEYDYPITKYTTNQIIIKHKKEFKQLVIEGKYLISELIHKNQFANSP